MNGTEFNAAFAGTLSALEQIFFFVSIILILLVGAWVTAILSGSHSHNSEKSPVNARRKSDKKIIRHLTLHRLQSDEFGFIGERLLNIIRSEYASSFWSKWTPKNRMSAFHISTGLSGKRGPLNETFINHTVEISLDGSIKNKRLNLRFFPQGPLHIIDPTSEKSDVSIQQSSEATTQIKSLSNLSSEESEPFVFVYECSDFPLFELKEISLEGPQSRRKQKANEALLQAMVAGIMSRGCGVNNQIVSLKKLSKWARQLDSYLNLNDTLQKQVKATKTDVLQNTETQMIVVAAWCYLVAGLGLQNEKQLKRSLELYEGLSEEDWQGREKTEMAGAQSNEAYAAYALMQLNAAHNGYPIRVKQAVLKAMRNFRKDNFPHSWGKLMCKLAMAETGSGGSEQETQELRSTEDRAEAGHSFQSIELALDEAIEIWRKNRQEDAMCEAYFAKGKLALNSAKRNMGVQGLERAENGFLAALSLSCAASKDHNKPFMKISRSDIRLELGKLYLSWGTRFGEAELIEKAIHHFEALLEESRHGSKNYIEETNLALAECYLNFGGITNQADHHKQAIFRFNDCLDQGVNGQIREKVERSISVARARLALVDRSKEQVETAISSICAVIGQNGKLWPTKDVLLRLRARLRELLFALEGDDIALDRAIKDRRDLVKLAESGAQDVRWAVEVGDLVSLLSKRQYKNNGRQEDFSEAHYLLENAISIVEESADVEESSENLTPELDIPHIRGTLYLNLAKLLASFARVHFDEQALNEAANYYQKFINLTPRAINPRKRAEVLSQIGLIMMDLSEQYGSHSGLKEAIASFAEAHDIYLEAGLIDLSNRMRRFLENAQAAQLAYQLPDEEGL